MSGPKYSTLEAVSRLCADKNPDPAFWQPFFGPPLKAEIQELCDSLIRQSKALDSMVSRYQQDSWKIVELAYRIGGLVHELPANDHLQYVNDFTCGTTPKNEAPPAKAKRKKKK